MAAIMSSLMINLWWLDRIPYDARKWILVSNFYPSNIPLINTNILFFLYFLSIDSPNSLSTDTSKQNCLWCQLRFLQCQKQLKGFNLFAKYIFLFFAIQKPSYWNDLFLFPRWSYGCDKTPIKKKERKRERKIEKKMYSFFPCSFSC